MPQSPFLLGLASLLCLPLAPAMARLGFDEPATIELYGDPLARIPATLAASDEEALQFVVSGVLLTLQFKGGEVWHITYQKSSFSPDEQRQLLDVNSGGQTWGEALTVDGRSYRRRSDGQAFSIYDQVKGAESFTLVTETCRAALAHDHATRLDPPKPTGGSGTPPIRGL